MYLYCLGMIPPLLSVSQRNTEDFMDAGFITLLSRHLISFYEENRSNYFSIMTPLLLALKALVSCNSDMKEELSVNMEVVSVLYNTVCNSFGSRYNLLPLHISGTILMCELGHPVFSQLISNRIAEMQEVQAKADENKKVKFKEKINRVIEWADQFKMDCKIYTKHQEAIQTIKMNIFDDDLIEKSLISLKELW